MLAASRWEGADLKRIVTEEVEAFAGTNGRCITLEGPPLLLRPAAAQSLALVIHELATNSFKYGALSVDGGKLSVGWQMGGSDRPSTGLRLVWTETGGPPVAPRTAASPSGFGTRRVRGSVERQLGDRLDPDWLPTGLSLSIEVPLERLLWIPQSPEACEPTARKLPPFGRRSRSKAA